MDPAMQATQFCSMKDMVVYELDKHSCVEHTWDGPRLTHIVKRGSNPRLAEHKASLTHPRCAVSSRTAGAGFKVSSFIHFKQLRFSSSSVNG